PEGALQRELLSKRNAIWGNLLTILNAIVAKLSDDSAGHFTSSHRLADFHLFGRSAAPVLRVQSTFEAAIEKLNYVQLNLLAEGDERLELLNQWVRGRGPGWLGEDITSADLFKQIRVLYAGPERTFPFKSPAALGTFLGRYKEMIHQHTTVNIAAGEVGHSRGWQFSLLACEGVNAANPMIPQQIHHQHAITPLSEEVEVNCIEEEVIIDED